MDYREYTIMLSEYRLKEELHERLRQLVEGNSQVVKYLFKKSNNKDANFQVGISADAWQELDTNWQKVAAQVLAFCSLACHEMIKYRKVRHWQWLLDTGLPGDFGQIGEWLNQGEGLVHSEDVPSHLNEEAAAVLNQKIDDHKAFFADLEHIREQG